MLLVDLPIAGDWNADGLNRDRVSIDREPGSISRWTTAAPGIRQPIVYLAWDNAAGDLPIAGDWNADGHNRDRSLSTRCRVLSQDGQRQHLESVNRSCILHGIMPLVTSRLPVTGMRMDGPRPGSIDRESGSISRWTTAAHGIRRPIVYLAWDNAAGDLPIAGDWNADGRTETGVYRPGAGFYLKMDNGSTWNPSTDRVSCMG